MTAFKVAQAFLRFYEQEEAISFQRFQHIKLHSILDTRKYPANDLSLHVSFKERTVQHSKPTVVLILPTNEIRPIAPDSYAAQFACGEAISIDPRGREPDGEVLCEECAKKRGFVW